MGKWHPLSAGIYGSISVKRSKSKTARRENIEIHLYVQKKSIQVFC